MKKFYFSLVATLCILGQQVYAQSGTIGNKISWTFQDEVLTISGEGAMPNYSYSAATPWYTYKNSIKDVVIGEGITHLGNYTFSDYDKLISVSLPNSLETIGEEVFNHCDALKEITFGNSLASIGRYAFSNCDQLQEITLPNSLTTIGEACFYSCDNISITFGNSLVKIEKHAFYACGELGNIVFPNSLTTIGEYAFYGCNINSITLGSGIKDIEANAFYGCNELRLIISNAATPPTLGNYALPSGITLVYVPAGSSKSYKEVSAWKNYVLVDGQGVNLNITVSEAGTLGDNILSKVENFSDVNILKVSGSLNSNDLSNIKNRLTSLVSLDLSNTDIKEFDKSFFKAHSTLRSIVLPKGLKYISEYMFDDCFLLEDIEFPESLSSIDYQAFSDCDALRSIEIPEGLTTIGRYAFYDCKQLNDVKLPTTLKTIDNSAFDRCYALKNVVLPEGLTHINSNAFGSCSIEKLTLPSTLYYIGDDAFAYNKSLKQIEFNEGLYQIGDDAFYDCDALTEITLPSTLVLAYQSPFDQCNNLKKVTCLAVEPPYLVEQLNYGVSVEGCELYVPSISLNVYKQTTGWDKFPTIKPIDYLPQNIYIVGDHKVVLPNNIPADYKPNVNLIRDKKNTSYYNYGSLTVSGDQLLSVSTFNTIWDYNYQYEQQNRSKNYCSLINKANMRADNVEIYIYTRSGRWQFISFPFDVKVSDIEPISEGTTNWIIRRYDGEKRAAGESDATWVKMGADEILKAGEGYIMQSSRYIETSEQYNSCFKIKAINNSNKNKIFTNSDATVTLNEYQSEFIHNRSWNLIGNPYPSYYDTRFIEFSAPITVWNMNNNTYTAYSPLDDSYILTPGEAFFVQCPVDNKNVIFNKDGRQIDRAIRTIEESARIKSNSESQERTVINIAISNGTSCDKTRLVVNEEASMLYEMDKDASKFMSSDATVPQIYILNDGIKYSINERPFDNGTAELCTRTNIKGTYSISLENKPVNYNIYLLDNKTGNKVSLCDKVYSFTVEDGENTARFTLLLDNIGTTGIFNVNTGNETEDAIYNLNGVKVEKPTEKGIYIQNGKKIIVK